MKRVISSTCLAAAFAVVGVAAQTPSSAPQSQATTATASTKPVTVTGCLKAGDEAGSFTLSNIKTADKSAASSASTTTSGTTGATGTSGATTTTTTTVNKDLENATVKLTGSPSGGSLADHVGHTVSITGTLNAAASAADAAAGAASAAGAAPATGAAKAQPSLAVSSVSMVSASCSQ